MEDFASTAMMRLVQVGLERQGLQATLSGQQRGAHVALEDKRSVLERVFDEHGSEPLIRIGESIDEMRDEPLLVALGAAKSPHDLLDRWRRLERFAHSRHRIELVQSESKRILIRHISLRTGEAPKPEEDLLIFGVIVGLIKWIGAVGLRARFSRDADWLYDDGWRQLPVSSDYSTWEVSWECTSSRASRLIQSTSDSDTLRDYVAQDLTRRWTVAAAAQEMGRSTRSLQRNLSQQGTSFSTVVQDVRTSAAAQLLQDPRKSLSEIGFVCGFADQAHFTRSFKAATAITPLRFREDFSISPRTSPDPKGCL